MPGCLTIPLESYTMRGAGREWRFEAPIDPSVVLNSLSDEECAQDKFQPYWAERWPATWVTFGYLAHLGIPAGSLVCEIGCGIGSVSAMLGTLGPRVVAVDISYDGCRLARRNMTLNASTASAVCCDWRNPPFARKFDVILGSEILYEERFTGPVLDFIDTQLAPDGCAYIADPQRPFWGAFKLRASDQGWDVRVVHQEVTNEGRSVVEIAELRRKSPVVASESSVTHVPALSH